jgi:hypothetical protein
MAGVLSERQETGVVDAVNSYYQKFGKPITVTAGSISIRQIVSAEKYGGRSSSGTEPYTDVILTAQNGKKYNISNKGTSAPSIAGGGLKGLELIIPGFSGKFLNAALEKYLKLGYKDGDQIPDMYGKVSDDLKETIVVGNVSMGGPIHYMYIGPMDVTSTGNGSVLRLNGHFHDAKRYAATHNLFLRLRKRRNDQPFTSKEKDKDGYPLILGKSPSAGDKGRRIVIVASIPSNALQVEF